MDKLPQTIFAHLLGEMNLVRHTNQQPTQHDLIESSTDNEVAIEYHYDRPAEECVKLQICKRDGRFMFTKVRRIPSIYPSIVNWVKAYTINPKPYDKIFIQEKNLNEQPNQNIEHINFINADTIYCSLSFA